MNKPFILISLLLLTAILSGCGTSFQKSNGQIATTTVFSDQQPGTYTIKSGEGISIAGKVIKVLDVRSSDGLVSLYVDGDIFEFPATREPKIARNLEIQTIRVDYGQTPNENTVSLDIKLFQLGKDEYYLRAGESVTVANLVVQLDDLTKNDGARITVGREVNDIIDLGQTKNIRTLVITHKRAFDNPVKANRYALLGIKEIGT